MCYECLLSNGRFKRSRFKRPIPLVYARAVHFTKLSVAHRVEVTPSEPLLKTIHQLLYIAVAATYHHVTKGGRAEVCSLKLATVRKTSWLPVGESVPIFSTLDEHPPQLLYSVTRALKIIQQQAIA